MELTRRAVAGLKKVIRTLSPNCREASRLQSEQLERPLSGSQRVGLRIHLLLCRWCRRYGSQLHFLRRVAREPEWGNHPGEKVALSPGARERLKRAVRERESRQ